MVGSKREWIHITVGSKREWIHITVGSKREWIHIIVGSKREWIHIQKRLLSLRFLSEVFVSFGKRFYSKRKEFAPSEQILSF